MSTLPTVSAEYQAGAQVKPAPEGAPQPRSAERAYVEQYEQARSSATIAVEGNDFEPRASFVSAAVAGPSDAEIQALSEATVATLRDVNVVLLACGASPTKWIARQRGFAADEMAVRWLGRPFTVSEEERIAAEDEKLIRKAREILVERMHEIFPLIVEQEAAAQRWLERNVATNAAKEKFDAENNARQFGLRVTYSVKVSQSFDLQNRLDYALPPAAIRALFAWCHAFGEPFAPVALRKVTKQYSKFALGKDADEFKIAETKDPLRDPSAVSDLTKAVTRGFALGLKQPPSYGELMQAADAKAALMSTGG